MMAMNFKFRVPKFLKSVRYCLAAVNSVFLLTGLLLVFVGIAVIVRYAAYDELITQRFFTFTGFVIATGAIILLGTVLGFYGALSQYFWVIAGYVVFLLVILVFEISILIAGFKLSNDAPSVIRSTMVSSLQQYGQRIEITKIWDDLQMGFECCGVTGPFDWIVSQIPVSCCHIDYGTISPFECTSSNAYRDGCSNLLGEYLSNQAYIIAVTASVAAAIQVILAVISGYLAYRSRHEQVEFES